MFACLLVSRLVVFGRGLRMGFGFCLFPRLCRARPSTAFIYVVGEGGGGGFDFEVWGVALFFPCLVLFCLLLDTDFFSFFVLLC